VAVDRFEVAIAALVEALDQHPQDYAIIGGLAAIRLGVPRFTADIDLVFDAQRVRPSALLAELAAVGIVPRIPNAEAFAEQSQVLLLRHQTSDLPIDISLGWLPFEREALDRAIPQSFGGASARVITAEDLVIFKAIASRPRDLDDIRKLLQLHSAEIDLQRVRHWVNEFCLVLEDFDRARRFEALVAATG